MTRQLSLYAAIQHVQIEEVHDPPEFGAQDGCRLCKRYLAGIREGDIGECSHGPGFRGDAKPDTMVDVVTQAILDIIDAEGVVWTDQFHGFTGGTIGSAFSRLHRWGLIKPTGGTRTSKKRESNGRPAYEWVSQ